MFPETQPAEWPFGDPPNVAVITGDTVLDRTDWIHYVVHGAGETLVWWEFHPSKAPASEETAKVVALDTIVGIDRTSLALADLPLNWCAWRDTKDGPWRRKRINTP